MTSRCDSDEMGNGNVSIGNWFVGDEFSVPYDKHAMKLGKKKEKKKDLRVSSYITLWRILGAYRAHQFYFFHI